MTVRTSSHFYMCIVRSDASFGSSTLTHHYAETRTVNARKKRRDSFAAHFPLCHRVAALHNTSKLDICSDSMTWNKCF